MARPRILCRRGGDRLYTVHGISALALCVQLPPFRNVIISSYAHCPCRSVQISLKLNSVIEFFFYKTFYVHRPSALRVLPATYNLEQKETFSG